MGDLVLDFCEYSCILKELRSTKNNVQGVMPSCASGCWHGHHMTLAGLQGLRKSVVPHVRRDPDFHTGWDGARARNVLGWWLEQAPTKSAVCKWPEEASTSFSCLHCGDVMPVSRCVCPSVKFCDKDCQNQFMNEGGGAAKRRRKK